MKKILLGSMLAVVSVGSIASPTQTNTTNQNINKEWSQQNNYTDSYNGASWNRINANVNQSQQNQITDSYNTDVDVSQEYNSYDNRYYDESDNSYNDYSDNSQYSATDSGNNVNGDVTATGGYSNADSLSNSYSEGGSATGGASDSNSTSSAVTGDSTSTSSGGDSSANVGNVSSGGNVMTSGATSLRGGATSVNTTVDASTYTQEAMVFETAYDTIGSVSKARTVIQVEAGHSERQGNAIRIGMSIPLTWGSNPTDDALQYATDRLRDDNIRQADIHYNEMRASDQRYTQLNEIRNEDKEKHEGEMFSMCMELHKLGAIKEDSNSGSLWTRCSGYIAFDDSAHRKDGHNGSSNPRQVSGHNH